MRITTFVAAVFVASVAAASDQQSAPTVYEPGQGVLVPRPLKQVKATYPPQALAKRIQGSVLIHAVVMEDGKIVDVTVAESKLWPYLGAAAKGQGTVKFLTPEEVTKLGFDKAAIDATKQWTFQPGTKDGKPVAVRIRIEMAFSTKPATKRPEACRLLTVPLQRTTHVV
jgi:outer membrane biosynthesis protein TonB